MAILNENDNDNINKLNEVKQSKTPKHYQFKQKQHEKLNKVQFNLKSTNLPTSISVSDTSTAKTLINKQTNSPNTKQLNKIANISSSPVLPQNNSCSITKVPKSDNLNISSDYDLNKRKYLVGLNLFNRYLQFYSLFQKIILNFICLLLKKTRKRNKLFDRRKISRKSSKINRRIFIQSKLY
jgi:hypothetical protein